MADQDAGVETLVYVPAPLCPGCRDRDYDMRVVQATHMTHRTILVYQCDGCDGVMLSTVRVPLDA